MRQGGAASRVLTSVLLTEALPTCLQIRLRQGLIGAHDALLYGEAGLALYEVGLYEYGGRESRWHAGS